MLFMVVSVFYLAPWVGSSITFLSFDAILSFYLYSLFKGKIRYLFLLHPILVFLLSFGFGIPYNEIGTGFTYLRSIEKYTVSGGQSLDATMLMNDLLFSIGGFARERVYVGTIPIIIIPRLMFGEVPDLTNYFSINAFTILYAAIGVTIGLSMGIMRKELLLIIALFATVSPTFLEINVVIHRYGLMFLGLWLFLQGYMGFLFAYSLLPKIRSYRIEYSVAIFVGIVMVFVSRPPLIFSLILFVLLESFFAKRIPIFSSFFLKCSRSMKVFIFILSAVVFQLLALVVLPKEYVEGFAQSGAGMHYQVVLNFPLVGPFVRVLYAALSPFPFLGFTQLEDIYGNNYFFLILHFFSVVVVVWVLMSLIFRFPAVISDDDSVRIVAIFGVSILLSLAFSAVGFHQYIAPAIPFLAVILMSKRTRVNWLYAVGFVVCMEIFAQAARSIMS